MNNEKYENKKKNMSRLPISSDCEEVNTNFVDKT